MLRASTISSFKETLVVVKRAATSISEITNQCHLGSSHLVSFCQQVTRPGQACVHVRLRQSSLRSSVPIGPLVLWSIWVVKKMLTHDCIRTRFQTFFICWVWLREGGGALCAAGEFVGDGGGLTASKGLPHPPSPPKGRGRVRENAAPVHSSNPYFNLILIQTGSGWK